MPRRIGDALREDDIVHHYAWSTVPASAEAAPVADLEANVRGTLVLLQALQKKKGARLIFTSSGGTVYGRLRYAPADELHPLDPISAYGAAKVAAEKYIGAYAFRGLDCRIARISNPYGAGQKGRGQGAVTLFLRLALAGEPIEVWGDGSVVRDYIDVSDVARGLVAIADLPPGEHPDRSIFNIGSGEGLSLRDILAQIGASLRQPLNVTYKQGRAFDVPVNVLDISRAAAILAWTPQVGLEAGIQRLVDSQLASSAQSL